MVGEDVSEILTIKRAVYSSSSYNVTGNTTVVYDGEEHTLGLSTRAGLDGVTITYENITGSFVDAGEHTIVFRLTGSDNYEPIPDFEVTLTILRATVDFNTDEDKKNETDVTVDFENGLGHEWELKVENVDTSAIVLEDVFENSKLNIQALYEFIITDANGDEQAASGKTTVTILVPKKFRDSDTLTFIQVTEKKGKLVIKEFDDVTGLKKNYSYDAETGLLTFTVDKLTDAKYGFVAENPFPIGLVLGIAGGVIAVAAAVVVVLVILKKKGPKTPKAPKAPKKKGSDAIDDLADDAPIASADTPWWETPVDDFPATEETPVVEAPVEETAVEEVPVEETPVAEEIPEVEEVIDEDETPKAE
jgi:hypothetical protein